jgi:intracellular septation protein
MKFLFDLNPVILFFVAYNLARRLSTNTAQAIADWLGGDMTVALVPILIATLTAIVASLLQIAALLLMRRKVEKMLWVSLAIVAVFGGATLFFRDPTFIKWKPTVLYWLFSAVLAGSALFLRRNLIRNMLEAQVQLPEPVWGKLNMAWALFFAALGLLNLYVAYGYAEETWVNFKLFGCTALVFLFALAQGPYLAKHMIEETPQ